MRLPARVRDRFTVGERPGDLRSAHVFFLPDGGLVFGLSVWDRWLEALCACGAHGYWTGECPAEVTTAAFIAVAQRAGRTGPL